MVSNDRVAFLGHALYNDSMKNITRILLSTAILFLIMSVLTGCIPNNFTEEEKNAFLEEAREAALSYLSDRYSGAEIQEIQPETTAENGGYDLTQFAGGQFVWQDRNYDFLVNTETGEVYTSVYLDEIAERLKEALIRELGIAAEETAVEYCSIFYLKGDKKLSQICYENIFPEEESAEKLFEKILQDTETYWFGMRLQYKGEDLSLELMDREAPFSTLSSVSICHVAEEHALYEGEYGYLTLPSLSKEILELGFYNDTAHYTRYQTLERDGIRVTYNAYERNRKRNVFTESVINEEDVVLTMTNEFIRLDCAKDGCSIYLSTEDKKIARKYLYVFQSSDVILGEKTEKGMWYPFEDSYVYADNIYVKVPYEIIPSDMDSYEGNVIYSKPRKK